MLVLAFGVIPAVVVTVAEQSRSNAYYTIMVLLVIAAASLLRPFPVWPLRSRGGSVLILVAALVSLVVARPLLEPGQVGTTEVAALPSLVAEDFYWDEHSEPFRDIVVRGVNKARSDNERCFSLDPTSAARSIDRGTDQNPVFYVTCRDEAGLSFNVYFSKADVEVGRNLRVMGHIARQATIELCELYAKKQAAQPATVVFSTGSDMEMREVVNGRTRIDSTFTTKNAFGVQRKFSVSCIVDASGLIEGSFDELR